MNRKFRCSKTNKLCHKEFYNAIRHLKRQTRKNLEGVDQMRCFKCRHCGYWHIGHCRPVVAQTI